MRYFVKLVSDHDCITDTLSKAHRLMMSAFLQAKERTRKILRAER